MPDQRYDIDMATLLQAQQELLLSGGPGGAPGPQPAPLATPQPEEDAFVSARHYAFLVYSRKWTVLLVTAIVVALAGAFSYWSPRTYQCQARVAVEERPAGLEAFPRRRPVSYDPDIIARLADSEPVRQYAQQALALELDAALSGTRDLSSGERDALQALRRKAGEQTAMAVKEAGVEKYKVVLAANCSESAPGRVPAMVARAMATAHAKGLIRRFTELTSWRGEIERLDALVQSNEEEICRVEGLLKDRAKSAGTELSAGTVGQLDSIAAKRRALAHAAMEKDRLEKAIKDIEAVLRSSSRQVAAGPELETRILRLETEVAQMRERYQPGHPKLQRAEGELDALRKLRTGPESDMPGGESGGLLTVELLGLRRDLRRVLAEIEIMSKDIANAEKAVASSTAGEEGNAIRYQVLIREHRALEEIGASLRSRRSELQVALDAESKSASGARGGPLRLETPVPQAQPVGAGPGRVVGFAVLVGLFLGVLLALLFEHLDDTVRNELSVSRASGLPVIARLPRFDGTDEKRFISPAAPRSDVAETFKFLHNHVRYTGPDAPEKCLHITSPGPEEGKSYVAVNLALSFASEGNRVCFVDADLRRSKTHERLDVLRPAGGDADSGLCGYLEGGLAYEDVLVASEIENLHLVLAGGRAANPPRLLRSERMRELLDRLQSEFDVVILDAPPVLPVVDSAIISSMARATLLVVRFGFTRQGDLAESADRLAHVNAPLAGVIINGIHGAAAGYSYRYRYRYGTGYSYGA